MKVEVERFYDGEVRPLHIHDFCVRSSTSVSSIFKKRTRIEIFELKLLSEEFVG